MLLYNITIILDEEIQQSYLKWLKFDYSNLIMSSGFFVSNRILKVLDSPNEGVTYCMQLIAESAEKYNEYLQKQSIHLQNNVPSEYLDKFVLFNTLMEFIEAE